MEDLIQLLLPLKLPEDRIRLSGNLEQELIAAMASLLLQVQQAEKGEEARDEHRRS